MDKLCKVVFISGCVISLMIIVTPPSYASDYEVNKQEFNDKWQQTYNDLAKSDPKAAEEFYRVTQEAFTQGEIAFANQKNEAVGDTIEGSATRPPAARIAETATLNQGIGLSNALDVALMTNENIKAEDIGKIREAMRVIFLEASLVSWDSLTPQEKTLQEQSIERYFKEMTGCNMKEVFAPLHEGAVVTSVATKTEVTGTLLQEAGTSGAHGTETLSTSPQAIGTYIRPEENMPQAILAVVGVAGAPMQGDWMQAVGDRHIGSIAVPQETAGWTPPRYEWSDANGGQYVPLDGSGPPIPAANYVDPAGSEHVAPSFGGAPPGFEWSDVNGGVYVPLDGGPAVPAANFEAPAGAEYVPPSFDPGYVPPGGEAWVPGGGSVPSGDGRWDPGIPSSTSPTPSESQ